MLDATVIRRDVKACIAEWPVNIRHYYDINQPTLFHAVTAALSRADELSLLDAGALIDNMSLSVFFATVDLTPLPLNRDRVDVQQRDGSWAQLEVKHTPDNPDPLAEMIELRLGAPNL
jgi:hypothetical protein